MRVVALAVLLALASPAVAEPTFTEVGALFAERCVKCHSGPGAPNGLDLSSHETALAGGWNGPVAIAGDTASPILQHLRGLATPRMPLDGPPFLDHAQIDLVEAWIMAGMPPGELSGAAGLPRPRPGPGADVLWPDVEPIFNQHCIECHKTDGKMGPPPEGVKLTSLAEILAGSERPVLLPGNPALSQIWRRITGIARPQMPFDGPPYLTDEDIRLIADWITQGARDADGNPAPVPVGAELRLRGILTGDAQIDGADFVIDGSTRIDDRPRIGQQAEMRGVVQADGTVRATRFRDR